MVDAAGILAPFGQALGRMADALYDDLGIDLHVVTTTDTAASIEVQSNETFEERRIGADAWTGGLCS